MEMVNRFHWKLEKLEYLGQAGAISLMNGIEGAMGGSPFVSYVHPDFKVTRWLPDGCSCASGADSVRLKESHGHGPRVHRHDGSGHPFDGPLGGRVENALEMIAS